MGTTVAVLFFWCVLGYIRRLDEEGKLVLDLGDTVRKMKRDFGVEQVLAWHAMTGYWAGVESTAPEMAPFDPHLTELLAPKGIREVDPEVGPPGAILAQSFCLFALARLSGKHLRPQNYRTLSRHTAHRCCSLHRSIFRPTPRHLWCVGLVVVYPGSERSIGKEVDTVTERRAKKYNFFAFALVCTIGPYFCYLIFGLWFPMRALV